MSEEIEKLAELITQAGEGGTAALTGAGISVPSGVPDFRTPGKGLWSKVNPQEYANIGVWKTDPAKFWSFYRYRLDIAETLEPNPAHLALRELEELRLLRGVATQNIDGLHSRAGGERVAEVHGSVRELVCLHCGTRIDRSEGIRRADAAQDGVPRCEAELCLREPGALHPLKPAVVLFGEMLPREPYERARDWISRANVLLCVGTSLVVEPVASLPELVLYHPEKTLAIVTKSRTPYDTRATVKLSGDVAEELPALVEAVRERL